MNKQPNGRRLWLARVAVLVASAAAATFWPDRHSNDDDPAAATSFDETFTGLCVSVAAATGGDLDRALGLFLRQSHTGLHTLAAEVGDGERRAVAARLLEAKADVEASLPARTDTAADDLGRLLDRTATAVGVATNADPPTC